MIKVTHGFIVYTKGRYCEKEELDSKNDLDNWLKPHFHVCWDDDMMMCTFVRNPSNHEDGIGIFDFYCNLSYDVKVEHSDKIKDAYIYYLDGKNRLKKINLVHNKTLCKLPAFFDKRLL